MNYFKSFFMSYWYYFVIGILVILLGTSLFFVFYDDDKKSQETLVIARNYSENEELKSSTSEEVCYVDIKGAVKKPGVYEIPCKKNISEAISLAGGITKSAYTDNINLSKRLKDEMVIYVFTKKEIKEKNKSESLSACKSETIYIDTCINNNQSVIENESNLSEEQTIINYDKEEKPEETKNDQKISLNKATKEELMTLSGVGESKALKIIEYRNDNGEFKSIEELKNVSGIGDSIFEKIKDNITI